MSFEEALVPQINSGKGAASGSFVGKCAVVPLQLSVSSSRCPDTRSRHDSRPLLIRSTSSITLNTQHIIALDLDRRRHSNRVVLTGQSLFGRVLYGPEGVGGGGRQDERVVAGCECDKVVLGYQQV